MSFPEVVYRILRYFQNVRENWMDMNWKGNAKLPVYSSNILGILQNGLHYPGYIEIFGLGLNFEEKIHWHQDLYTRKEFPRIFSKSLNIQLDKSGSAKHVWEVNRLLFLPWVCFNYVNTGDRKYLRQFMDLTHDWIKENPYLTGLNWYSNIEVNIRLLNWFLCWEILHVDEIQEDIPELKEFSQKHWLPVIYLHCLYSFRNPSRFSSANNHLIAEYAGLFIASSLWKFGEAEKWNSYAKKGLEKEIRKQHSEDGINKEEAAGYIQFITDFLLLAYLVGEKTNNGFSDNYKDLLHKIFQYIYRFTDMNVHFPRYGDEDDGRVFLLDPSMHHNNSRSLLTSGTVIFQDAELKTKSSGIDVKNKALFGEEGEKQFSAIKKIGTDLQSCFFPDEGHFILRKQQEDQEIYIHFDSADLGYLSIAAHGHADALSFILHVNGKEILVDPGTYTYHTDPAWRQYFIGTIAHNTIRIDRKNQALNGGPTLWLRHYKVKKSEWFSNEEFEQVIACHDGYKRLGVVHTRELKFNKKDNLIIVTDHIECRKRKDLFIEFPLHLHPDMVPNKDSKGISVFDENQKLRIEIIPDPGFMSNILKGSLNPLIGWYSKSFYRMESTFVIYQTAKVGTSTSFQTRIKIFP